ncbi:hypothetical protein [Phenylobacterium sp.]|uniref:hypothetical protein n=1 Tax=Phenylobacterium sp. TaxID=1871053 RepID=UPI002726ADCE|nr:hypothetical protein [Phenylobacterium sp.]MDO8378195.1 hypothetical protein [Phenylobacterium sp.]
MGLMVSWAEVVVAAVLGAFAWPRVRRLPVSRLRDWLSDLTWTPAGCLAIWACVDGNPINSLIFTLAFAPIAALRNVMFEIAAGSPPNDPKAMPEDVKTRRAETRAAFDRSSDRSSDG